METLHEKKQENRFSLHAFCLALSNDPVNTATGNFIYDHTDLNIPARIPLEFTRYYNSRDEYTGPLGNGWQHNYNTYLTVNEDNSVEVKYPDGHMFLFTYENGSYSRPTGCFENLSQNTDGTYVLTFKNQTKYVFDSQGKLAKIADKNDNSITMQYTGSLLTTATEPAGRSLNFEYDANDRLIRITDPAGRTVIFSYDTEGNLSSVQDFNGGSTSFAYGQYGLTTITDPKGNNEVINEYDADSRVIRQEDAKGNVTLFFYNPAEKKNAMTDPNGNTAYFYYDDKYRITQIDYPQNLTQLYTFDENYNRTSSLLTLKLWIKPL
ncbi:DUF6531 domain-containing protein [Pelotomaculum terephthalicicum]|uniref:DUF6531 domain-containing protein n=1 Tax=Pelotomaculum terephthalicicum TaxID=206393 RepID=UPI0028A00FD2|nr:DUF6531 domain-containing protein [Pelotomaculum terephthalicicum]